VSWLMCPPGVAWNPLTVFPLWGIVVGVTFFGVGIYWGRLYLLGLAFLGLSILMTLKLDLAPPAFMALLGLTLWILTGHIQRVSRARGDAENARISR
jgi:hypothetical protein